jgi:HEAT repeat protein
MLLYRPLLTAYRTTTQAPARRFLLRELADPELHAEPDELLAEIDRVPGTCGADEPARLVVELALRERLIRLRLTTRDSARELGGLWTAHSDSHREMMEQALIGDSRSAFGAALGAALGSTAAALLDSSSGPLRSSMVLAIMGDLGEAASRALLERELASGERPAAAALGLSGLGPEIAARALVSAVESRGLDRCAPWLGVALGAAPCAATLELLERMASSSGPDLREQAAWALGAFGGLDVARALASFERESNPFVRLNAIRSVGRLGVPGGRATLRRFHAASDPETLRTAVVWAAGHSTAAEMQPFLERALASGAAEERAEALQALVSLGVQGPAFIERARAAVGSHHGRLVLNGLLALCVWAPDDAFAHVRQVFAGAPGPQWFFATYALRYLRTDQTVSLLLRLVRTARGSELEEIAVSALCRHLHEPGALDALLAIAREGASPVVLHRIMQDIARHLPQEQVETALAVIRPLLKPGLDASLAGPLLVALGSLGGAADLPLLAAHTGGPAATAAVHAIELVDAPGIDEVLVPIARRGRTAVSGAAVVALFRRGSPEAPELLGRWAASREASGEAARCLVEMALSARCAPVVPAMAHLCAALRESRPARERSERPSGTDLQRPRPARERSERSPMPVAEAAPAALPASPGLPPPPPPRQQPPSRPPAAPAQAPPQVEAARPATPPATPSPARCPQAPQGSRFQAALSRPRRPIASKPVGAIRKGPAPGTGERLYREMGGTLRDLESGLRSPRRRKALFAGAALALVVLGGLGFKVHSDRIARASPDELGRFSRYPPLFRADVDPGDGPVKDDEVVEGTTAAPVKLVTRIRDNTLTLRGKFRFTGVSFKRELPPTSHLEGKLLTGSMDVEFPRGSARIAVEGARTTVEVVNGRATFEMKESTFILTVAAGSARIMRGVISMCTLTAGQSGEFLDGTPMGRIEDATPPGN